MLTEKELNDIRRKMLELEEEPPANGWGKIEADIRPWWRRPVLWWFGSGVLLLGTLGGSYYLQQERNLFSEPVVVTELPAGNSRKKTTSGVAMPELQTSGVSNTQIAEGGSDTKAPKNLDDDIQQNDDLQQNEGIAANPDKSDLAIDSPGANKQASTATTNIAAANGASSAKDATIGSPERSVRASAQKEILIVENALAEQGQQKVATDPIKATTNQQANERNQAKEQAAQLLNTTKNSLASATTKTDSGSMVNREKDSAVNKIVVTNSAITAQNRTDAPSERANTVAPGSAKEKVESITRSSERTSDQRLITMETDRSTADLAAGRKPLNQQEQEQQLSIFSKEIEQNGLNQKPSLVEVSEEKKLKATQFPLIVRRPAQWQLARGVIALDSFPLLSEEAAYALPEEPIVPDENKYRKEWSLAVFFAPRYTYRSFSPRGEDNVLITGLSNKNESGRDRIGYALGGTFGKTLSPRLQLESSISLLKLRENISYTYSNGTVDYYDRTVNSQGELEIKPVLISEQRQLISSYAYGSLQLGATYFFWQNKMRRFNIAAGGGVNLLLKGKTDLYSNGEWVNALRFPSAENLLEQTNYDLNLGLGYSRSVYQHYELTLMPTVSYYLGSTYKEREPFGLQTYTLGLKLQIRRIFNQQTR